MKIAIYSPYLDTFGGGERYMLTIAEYLSQSASVDVLLDEDLGGRNVLQFKCDLAEHFSLNLEKVHFIKGPVGKGSSFLGRLIFLKNYDLLFYLTDGSIFYSPVKKSIIHFQVPFKNTTGLNLWGRWKVSSWDLAICNSKFTKSYIDKYWPIKTMVVYPPVDVSKIKKKNKERMILSVGRFYGFLKSKKHEVMIKGFKKLISDYNLSGWSLHLVGSVVEGDEAYLKELTKLAEGLPVYLYPNATFDKLNLLYGQSSIYWHAAGYNETNPQNYEHFGITVAEAMAAGCVPVVVGKGGLIEIVESGVNGYLWHNIDQMVNLTNKLISNPNDLKRMAKNCINKAKMFSKEKFTSRISKIVNVE